MIGGIGTDLVEIARIRRALEHPRTGGRFRDRVFTGEETAWCLRGGCPEERFAARFAAKEAVMKALGKGFGDGVGWREIEVVRTETKPRIVLHGNAARLAEEAGVIRWHLSLSHDGAYAVAFTVAERAEKTAAED